MFALRYRGGGGAERKGGATVPGERARVRAHAEGYAGMRKSDEKEGVGLIAGSDGSATPLRLPEERRGSGRRRWRMRKSAECVSKRASSTKKKRKSKRESGRLAQLRRRRKEK